MVQRDYIQRMIDALSKVVAQLMGMKPPKGLDILQEAYQEHLKIEGDWLDGLAEEDLVEVLQKEKNLNVHQLEFLAELLAREGLLHLEMENPERAYSKWRKARILFDFVEMESDEYSFERRAMMAKIKNWLDEK